MREEVEHARAIGTHAERHEHVAELRTGGIGDDALDVVLDEADGGREEGRDGADDDDEFLGMRRQLEHGRQAGDHEDAGRHHGGGMDEGGNRCRAFHGVGEPGVQQELRRLAHGTHEEQQAEHRQRIRLPSQELHRLSGHAGGGGEDGVEVDRLEDEEAAEDAEREAEVAHAVDDEGLHGGGAGAVALVPETDEQVGREAHAFPAEEHLDEVVGRHQHEHGEGEEREIGEEARLRLVMAHVAERVDVDERRDGVHHHQHDGGERVHPDHPVGGERAGVDPVQDFDLFDARLMQEAGEDIPGENCAEAEQRRRQVHRPLGAVVVAVMAVVVVMAVGTMVVVMRMGMVFAIDLGVLAKLAEQLGAEEAGDQRADQRQEDDGGKDGVHDYSRQPFMRLMSSTAMVPRLRK